MPNPFGYVSSADDARGEASDVRLQWNRTLATIAVALVGTLGLGVGAANARSTSGNGEASKDVATIVADVKAATANVSSVRVAGTISEGDNRVSLNIVSAHGSGGGVMFQQGKKFQLVVHQPDLYMKAPASTWVALAGVDDTAKANALAQTFGGKWVRMSTANAEFGDLAQLFDISTFYQYTDDPGALEKLPVTTFRGKRAIPLRDDVKQTTTYVAATGAPYVLGVTSNGNRSAAVVFSEYGSAKIPPVPTHSIDLTSFQQSAG